MAYSAMTNLSTGDLVTETEYDKIVTNWAWMAAGGVAGSPFSGMSTFPTDLARIATGEYTGDDGATKAITGVGFQPRRVDIIPQVDGLALLHIKTDQEGTFAYVNGQYETDHIISLDADGFTVGDGTGGSSGNTANVNARVYTYIAFR